MSGITPCVSRLPLLLLALACGGLVGCASANKAALTRVVAAPPPVLAPERLAPPLSEERSKAAFEGQPPSAFKSEWLVTFAAAREAYWSYDEAKMTALLRDLVAKEHMGASDFNELVVQCFERDNRWADAVALCKELRLEKEWSGWLQYVEMRARQPGFEVEFAPTDAVLPCTLSNGELVIVDIEVNGQRARVLIDTGANLSLWTERFAQRAGLQKVDHQITLSDTHGAGRKVELALVRDLRLGALRARNVVGVISPWSVFNASLGVDGVVGWDVLQHANLIFDFPAKQLTVEVPQGRVVENPTLGGRIMPIVTTISEEGRPLHLFLDTGATSRKGGVDLNENGGTLATKVAMREFRRGWLPTVSMGLHSLRVRWPLRKHPFTFWMSGYRFETHTGAIHPGVELKERWSLVDGTIGNASFLSGRLTLCGVRRHVAFEPTVAVAIPAQ